MKPYVKICCIASHDEAGLAMSMEAAALGLVSAMPSGPGPIADLGLVQVIHVAGEESIEMGTFPVS